MFDPKKSGEEADQLIAGMNREGEAPSEDRAAEEATITAGKPTVEVDGGTEDAPLADVPVEEPVVVSEVPDVVTTQLADMQKMLDTSEQRWKVAQGMIEKKDGELEDMRALFAKLAADQTKAPTDPEAPAQPAATVTAEDIEEFSPELHKFIGKVAGDVARQLIAEAGQVTSASISTLQGTVDTVTETNTLTAQQLFDQRLTAQVTNWETVNTDPAFIAWLREADPFTGRTKLELLQDAYAVRDVNTTANFFRAFTGANAPPVEATVEPPRPNAADYVSPGKSKSSTAPAKTEGKQWSRTDISKLYDDKLKKRISQKNFDEQERDLFAAQQENRIVA
jgi:hypothetical protein